MKKKILPVLIPILLIILILGVTVSTKLIEKYSYSKEEMDLNAYYGLSSQEAVAMIHQDERIESQALLQGGEYYLPFAFVYENLNPRFYLDEADGLVLYTTPTELYEIPFDSADYSVSGDFRSHAFPICIQKAGSYYMSLSFLKEYANFICEVFTEPNRLQIYTVDEVVPAARITKDTYVRYQGGIKSDILTKIKQDAIVVLLDEMENWSEIKTDNGIIGYVENKYLEGEADLEIVVADTVSEQEYTSLNKGYPINLVWHQVTNQTANSSVDELLANTKAVNTISPTWFFLNDNSGNFTSIASQEYVDKMHARGIEVWALIDNFTNDVDISRILGTIDNRKNLIQNLIQETKAYQIDGINIDFEQVPASAGGDYVQFLRELSIACRKEGIILSVDNYVPTGYTEHYDRREQGTVVDYVIIMGYDEHYAGSAQPGSVASIGYVKQGIEKTVSLVPPNKVINGIPFYTRLWKLADDVTSEALSMNAAKNVLTQNNVTAKWDEETCQYFASYEADGATYQIWLEDTESIAVKLNVMNTFGLGGVAEWKLGLEDPAVWDQIENYVNNTQISTYYDGAGNSIGMNQENERGAGLSEEESDTPETATDLDDEELEEIVTD